MLLRLDLCPLAASEDYSYLLDATISLQQPVDCFIYTSLFVVQVFRAKERLDVELFERQNGGGDQASSGDNPDSKAGSNS